MSKTHNHVVFSCRLISKGASGGLGSGGVGSSRGSIVLTVLELHKDEEIYVLVGQSGEHACIKSMLPRADNSCENRFAYEPPVNGLGALSTVHMVKHLVIKNGAGGGGGGSYVFLVRRRIRVTGTGSAKRKFLSFQLNQANAAVPLLVAGGGGGLGIGHYVDEDVQQAQGIVPERGDMSGQAVQEDIVPKAGPGGGWRAKADNALDPHFGASLFEGSRGGLPCYTTSGKHGQGGFGGGGGGCNTGGGGGGYAGGDTMINSTNGEGGTSFLSTSRSVPQLSFIYPGANSGPGAVIIIPAIQGCGCDYRCVALDEYRSVVACICPEGWRLKSDNLTACECKLRSLGTVVGALI